MAKSKQLIYDDVVKALKEKIRITRLKTVLTVNLQMLGIYFEIGSTIAIQEKQKGWGAKIVEQLSKDLISEFPDMKGLSPRNLRYMREFAKAWPELSILQRPAATIDDKTILQQPAAKLPWGHNCMILDKLKTKKERLFYAQKAVENGWSRNMLMNQIGAGFMKKLGTLPNNFSRTLPAPDSELTQQLFKDPYNFILPDLVENAKERDLENAIVNHITRFLVEMGRGFSYAGRQVHFEQAGKDYYIDLLLYNLKHHFYLVIELKIGEFKPEYTGKMNFYLSLVDERLKTEVDKPSIGLILCKSKDNITVEYALRDIHKPIGVAGYELSLSKSVPKEFKNELPTIKELEKEIAKDITVPVKPIDEKISKLKEKVASLGKTPMELTRNDKSIREIFMITLPQLRKKLHLVLKDIIPMFDQAHISLAINGEDYPFNTNREFERLLIEPGPERVTSIGMLVHFEGFALGGSNTFELKYLLTIVFEKHKYIVGPANPRREFWYEKLYQEEFSEQELDELAEKWSELMLDQINQQVEQTK